MRLNISELIHAAYHAARYLPKASSQLIRDLAERLDTTQAALCESLKIRDALAAENAALKECAASHAQAIEHWNGWADAEDKIHPFPETPATDAWVNEQRATGVDGAIEKLITMLNHQSTGVSASINVLRTFAVQLRGSQV
ncbi:hypothetical protein ACH54D_10705 [Atlantibacter hermannii]|uniref:hypothetical protein n=1 Tax=Atlantibacter hermannii TaxID=565 RepID=UPI00379EC45A